MESIILKLIYKFRCGLCNFPIIEIHHIKSKRSGGKDSISNLFPLCPNCHALVHAGIIKKSILQEIHNTHLANNSRLAKIEISSSQEIEKS